MDKNKDFEKYGYCVLQSVISDEMTNFITQYALFDEMQNFNKESNKTFAQVENAHSKYADPAMETMLLNLHPIMEQITGLNLYPTYSYFRVYRPGDELKPHTDRESCEISTTVCFNFQYTDKNYSWPIVMDGNEVSLNPGDMVVYRGCDLSHWREKFIGEDDDWQVQGFFHYVDANGSNAAFKHDGRPSIGYKGPKIIQGEKPYIFYVD